MTVLFSDVAGFTTISEQLTPPELVDLLNEYLTLMTDIVLRYKRHHRQVRGRCDHGGVRRAPAGRRSRCQRLPRRA